MTADIRTAALTHARTREAHLELSGQHRTRVFVAGATWAQGRLTPTREQIARKLYDIRDDPYDVTEWEELDSTDREVYYCQADAVLALMEELAEGES